MALWFMVNAIIGQFSKPWSSRWRPERSIVGDDWLKRRHCCCPAPFLGIYNISKNGAGCFKALSPSYMYYYWSYDSYMAW